VTAEFERLGLLTAEQEQGGRRRRVYSLTEEGRSALGAWLAERWGLPADLVEAIACHHRPENATRNPELAFLVHVANSLAERAGFVWPRGVAPRPLTPSAWELVESDEARRETLLETLVEDVVRETERERELFAEFRGSQEE